MKRTIRTREQVSGLPGKEYLDAKINEGWRLCGLVWEREVEADKTLAATAEAEIPYGLEIAADCHGLRENSEEMKVLHDLLDLLVSERSLAEVASVLNERGHRNRGGEKWTETEIFQLLPRLIETTPRIFETDEWRTVRHIQGAPPA